MQAINTLGENSSNFLHCSTIHYSMLVNMQCCLLFSLFVLVVWRIVSVSHLPYITILRARSRIMHYCHFRVHHHNLTVCKCLFIADFGARISAELSARFGLSNHLFIYAYAKLTNFFYMHNVKSRPKWSKRKQSNEQAKE